MIVFTQNGQTWGWHYRLISHFGRAIGRVFPSCDFCQFHQLAL